MAGILKSQILKHLSRFSKNLTPEKINISTLKGEGELSNLELDEVILMDLLDLPTWMKLNKAVCNKVSIKIQWTKLKSQPICLYLDEVLLEIETCSEPRPPNNPSHESSYRSGGRYGFVDKVIDGIFVHINSVSVQFMSQKFHASLQLSRVKVQSLTPTWCFPTDLRQSRIRNEPNDEILLFKEVDWQTTRIEATACDEDMPTTPLRLIANQSKLRIVLKKRLSDCSIIASRIIFLLDDILWVLTDTQLKSAILYINSLQTMINKSTEQSKKLAAEKLHKQGQNSGSGSDQIYLQQQQLQKPRSQTNEARHFQRFDVTTTSYHVITSRIDLHLCDDTPMNKESSPNHNKLIDGGAMQITFCKLSLDYYPFHIAGGERKGWYRYTDNQGSRNSWVQDLFKAFCEEVAIRTLTHYDTVTLFSSPEHDSAHGGERKGWYRYTDNQGSRNSWVQDLFKAFREEVAKARETCKVMSPSQSPAHKPGTKAQTQNTTKGTDHQSKKPRVTKLLESCLVLRIEEFIIYRVSTSDNKRSTPQKFFSSDKKALHLPSDMSVIHMEYTEYFFTEGIDYPVPHANLYILVNPVRLTLDYITMLWANYFTLNFAQMQEPDKTEMDSKEEHVDTKIEFLMPRVVMPMEEKSDKQSDRPESLQIQISKLTATNTHIEPRFTLQDLREILCQYQNCDMFSQTGSNDNDLQAIPKLFSDIANGHLNPYLCPYAKDLVGGKLPEGMNIDSEEAIKMLMRTNTLKRDASCDMWSVCVDQVWVEFLASSSSRSRPVPFVESVPLTLWMCRPSLIPDGVISQSSSMNDSLSNSDRNIVGNDQERRRKKRQLLKDYYSEDSVSPDSVTEKSINGDSSTKTHPNTMSGNHGNCDNGLQGNVQYTALKLADYNIVAKIGGKIRAQLNHTQYIALMRLSDFFTEFLTQLDADTDDLQSPSTSSENYSIPLMIPELEFAMVCPYIAQLLPYSHPLDTYNSPGTNSSVGRGEVYGEADIDVQDELAGNQVDMSGMTEQILTVTQDDEGSSIAISDSLAPDNIHMVHSHSDSTILCHTGEGVIQGDIPTSIIIRKDSHSTDDVCQEVSQSNNLEILGHNPHLTGSDSGLSSLGSSFTGQRSRAGSKLTPTTVKKTFSAGMSNIVGKIKNTLGPDDFDDDNISLKTDISDDDFEFLSVDENEAPAFSHANRSDTASSTDTDDLSSVFAESTSASKAKETVSAIVFRLSGSEVLIQKNNEDLSLQVYACCVETEETGNVIYEDFYAKLASPYGVMREAAVYNEQTKYPLKFQYRKGPKAGRFIPEGKELGMMAVRAKDFEFKISKPSVMHLADFIEDEVVGTPIPMIVSLKGLTFVLTDDSPQGVSVPPVTMKLEDLFISRRSDGIFHIKQESSQNNTENNQSSSEQSQKMHSDNASESLQAQNTNNSNETSIKLPELHNVNPATGSNVDNRIKSLENQNQQLRTLLDKLDNYSQEQENKLEALKDIRQKCDNLETENKKLRDQLKTNGIENDSLTESNNVSSEKVDFEAENSKLMERIVTLEDEMVMVKTEKDSLIATLKMLQDELMVAEQYRHRTNHNS